MTWGHFLNTAKINFDVQLLEQIEQKYNDRVKLTLKLTKDLCNAVDSSGDSLLHYAAKFGNEIVTSYLIELGAKINVENKDGDTPLLLATKGQHAATIKILLKSDANIYICNKNGESAVQIALQTSPLDFKIAKLFLRQVSKDCSSDNTEITKVLMKIKCPLYTAVLLENVDVTTSMISEGCSMKAKDPESGKTVLHVAVENVDMKHVKKLIFLGADVNAKDASGKTPLALLSDFSKSKEALEIIEILLKAKTKLTSYDKDGSMQIRSIIQNGTDETVKMVLFSRLFSSGDVTVKDKNKRNIVHYLASNFNPGIEKLIDPMDYSYEHFRIDEFDLNARDKFGLTALHYAMNVGNTSFVKFLISKKVNLHVLSNKEISPLLQAVQSTLKDRFEQRVECVKILLRNKAQPDIFLGHYFKIHDNESEIDRDYALIEPAIAELAIWKATAKPFHQGISKKIRSYPKLEKFMNACTIELGKMKRQKISGNLTVLDILADHDDIYRYSMFFVFDGHWVKRVIRQYQSISIYYEILDKRVCQVMSRKKRDLCDFIKIICFIFSVFMVPLLALWLLPLLVEWLLSHRSDCSWFR